MAKEHFSNGSTQIEVIVKYDLKCIYVIKNCKNQNLNKCIVKWGEDPRLFGVLPRKSL